MGSGSGGRLRGRSKEQGAGMGERGVKGIGVLGIHKRWRLGVCAKPLTHGERYLRQLVAMG